MSGFAIVLTAVLLLFVVIFFLFLHVFLHFSFYQALSRNDEDLFEKIHHGLKGSQLFGADMDASFKAFKSWYSIITLKCDKVTNKLLLKYYKLSFILFVFSVMLYVAFFMVVPYVTE